MANVVNNFSSNYTYTDNIRLFKENDPYHYTVDNIPLQQLQNNIRYLRELFLNSQLSIEDIDRSSFGELKPYFEGNDRTLKIKPGRFTARINSAYSDNPLQKLIFSDKTSTIKTLISEDSNVIRELVDKLVNQEIMTNANGLSDRISFWATVDPETPLPTILIQNFGPSLGQASFNWPLLKGFDSNFDTVLRQGLMGKELQDLHMELVKQWQGVARTAIVDIPETLEVDIPDFDIDDFFSVDSANQKIATGSTPSFRIDLVFIYSKPVDSSGVPIVKFDSEGQPYVLTTPAVGILKGAGLGYSNVSSLSKYSFSNERPNTLDAFGNPAMIPNAADTSGSTNGFLESALTSRDVHGSFPSPEDLLNIAPNLIADLESNDLQLIGQSILPICYILVENDNSLPTNVLGQTILSNSDILDIRPFFRTAELTYNERAGLAGAVPALSLANPAVGKAQLYYELQKIKDEIGSNNGGGGGGGGGGNGGGGITTVDSPRPIAKAYVWGGWLYGPEGALWDAYEKSLNNNSTIAHNILNVFAGQQESNGLTSNAKNILGFPDSVNLQVPIFPTWDFPEWTTTRTDRGLYPNDWMDCSMPMGAGLDAKLGGCPGMRTTTRNQLNLPAQNNLFPGNLPTPGSFNSSKLLLRFCKKTITITNIPTWVKDTLVQANYLNCMPLADANGDGNANSTGPGRGGWSNISITKSEIINNQQTITVVCSWLSNNKDSNSFSNFHPRGQRSDYSLAGTLAISPKFNQTLGLTQGDSWDTPLMGVAIYPSIEIIITGLTEKYSDPTYTNYGLPTDPANKPFIELPAQTTGGVITGYDLQLSNTAGIRPWEQTITYHSTIKAL